MFDRRAMMQMLGSLSLTGLPAFADESADYNDPAVFLNNIVRMRGSADERLVMGWVRGTRYAVINHRATPIMGLLAATFSQYRRIRDDAYAVRALEVAYFTDLESGKLLESWKNPFTGKTVEVPRVRMGPSRVTLTAKGLSIDLPAGEAAGMSLTHRFRPAVVNGDDLWVTEEIHGESTRGGFVYNEMSTYHARRSDLADASRATVPTKVDFHGLVTFRPWMGFGDTPGHTTARGAGTRAARIEDLPRDYLELTERFNPDVLEDPLAALNADKS